ncbi:MAG: putative cobalt-precorrin-6Y C(15)-methyltransferase (decarboxylating) [Methanoregula sp. PtaU1.Bin051]|nr:MAG: putative cobalt-precorrin-6Y C(15)-methyltransferase (decarboxylating) [Methanoregula sp. PtaU1.Bin051]
MSAEKIPGGPTQDEVLAIDLFKLGIRPGDVILDLGCGTGKVSIAAARAAHHVVAIDRRAEAIRFAKREAKRSAIDNIEFRTIEGAKFLGMDNRIFDCAFVGGSRGLSGFLPALSQRVRRTIVVNAVLLSTINTTVSLMQDLGIFREILHVQVSRSQDIGGSLMFRPIDPVYIIVGNGGTC